MDLQKEKIEVYMEISNFLSDLTKSYSPPSIMAALFDIIGLTIAESCKGNKNSEDIIFDEINRYKNHYYEEAKK